MCATIPARAPAHQRRVDDPCRSGLEEICHDYDDGRLNPPSVAPKGKGGIVGSGCGPGSRHELARMGYQVRLSSPTGSGGVAAWAIPAFRLPREILREISTTSEKWASRSKQEFTLGLKRRSRTFGKMAGCGDRRNRDSEEPEMNIGERGSSSRVSGLSDFLKRATIKGRPLGNHVLVIGGNAAVDTARSALRKRAPR